ncbi:MAG TPA: phosphatase PAP2 family protein [Thermoanaerobaculia bacterium]|nr:phosphatase PAP2 family protein [Thermoanaerobaculia bacterium]
MKKDVKKDARKKEKPPRRRQRFLPHAIGVSGGVVLATIAFWFFKKQADHVIEGKADRIDSMVMESVHTIDNPVTHNVLHAVTQLGSHFAIGTAAGITALAMLRSGRKHDAWTVVVSVGGAMAINTILKNIFQRQRPQELARRIKLPDSHSFPSGHSLLSAATYPIVAHHFVQNHSLPVQAAVHTIAGMTILSVGFSRVYFGVHFPSDVLGGFAAGLGWLGLTSLSHTISHKKALRAED